MAMQLFLNGISVKQAQDGGIYEYKHQHNGRANRNTTSKLVGVLEQLWYDLESQIKVLLDQNVVTLAAFTLKEKKEGEQMVWMFNFQAEILAGQSYIKSSLQKSIKLEKFTDESIQQIKNELVMRQYYALNSIYEILLQMNEECFLQFREILEMDTYEKSIRYYQNDGVVEETPKNKAQNSAESTELMDILDSENL